MPDALHLPHGRNRRTWKPNVQNKRFWSETYNRFLQFRMVTAVIKKVQGLLGLGLEAYGWGGWMTDSEGVCSERTCKRF